MQKADPYGISARAYLERAKKRFSEKSEDSLIYAVLELRCAIEARLQEILDPHDHIPKKAKKTYKIENLSKTVANKLCNENTGSQIIIRKGKDHFTLRYIPVSSSLRKFAQNAGDYLHAAKRPYNKETWKKLRTEVESAIKKLEENLQGNLLGPALINKDGHGVLNIELIDDDQVLPAFAKDKNSAITISVDYFEVE